MSIKQINLLPKEQLKQLRWRTWFYALTRFYGFVALSLLVVILAYVLVSVYLNILDRKLEAESERLRQQVTTEETVELKKQVKAINSRIGDYNTLALAVPRWSVLFDTFAGLVPDGVQIQNFSVDSSKRIVSISGTATTRDAVILLHDNITKDTAHFEGIDYPLENVSKPRNVSFHFTFKVKETVLK